MAEDAAGKIKCAPFPFEPGEFGGDDRINYDQVTQSYKLEAETGQEWEWLERQEKWVQVVCFPVLSFQPRQLLAVPPATRLSCTLDANT